MTDMIKVENKGKMAVRVGDVVVPVGAEKEVDASILAEMSDKDAGKAANALAADLKKAAGRKTATKKDEKAAEKE